MPRSALFTLAFARPPAVTALSRRHLGTRRVILQKARDHACSETEPRALTAWTRSVSGSVSLPSPGCFSPFPHGTVRYRSRRVVGLGPWSAPLPTRLLVSRGTRDDCHRAALRWYGTVTRSGAASQPLPPSAQHRLTPWQGGRQVSQPRWRNGYHLDTPMV